MDRREQTNNNQHPEEQPSGISLGRLLGIPVVLHWSLFIAAALIILTVGMGPLQELQADWPAATLWTFAVMAAAGLFAAIYLHELGHALVARRYGIKTIRITLFVLGGMAQMAEEPKSWRAELWIALAGPAVSFVLGVALLGLALLALPAEPDWTSAEAFFAALSPTAALMLWLGNVNLMLAIFNCIPAFPLDGGRVLRAALWAMTRSLTTATRWSARGGKLFGYVFIGYGLIGFVGITLPFVGSSTQGLWLAMIGWFLTQAAGASTAALQRDTAAPQSPEVRTENSGEDEHTRR